MVQTKFNLGQELYWATYDAAQTYIEYHESKLAAANLKARK